MTTLSELMAKLPAKRRAKILARADELILEETTLQQARQARGKTQTAVADSLKIGQDSVSRIEKRGDMLVSTLRDYVAAIGGKVRVVIEFEDQPPVELIALGAKPAPTSKGTPHSARRPKKVA